MLEAWLPKKAGKGGGDSSKIGIKVPYLLQDVYYIIPIYILNCPAHFYLFYFGLLFSELITF